MRQALLTQSAHNFSEIEWCSNVYSGHLVSTSYCKSTFFVCTLTRDTFVVVCSHISCSINPTYNTVFHINRRHKINAHNVTISCCCVCSDVREIRRIYAEDVPDAGCNSAAYNPYRKRPTASFACTIRRCYHIGHRTVVNTGRS